jgi:nicotinate-nucleotide--dimethylbenzimidazole phosphoribosyltransferase
MKLREQLEYKIQQKTKPPGSLGRLEEIALQIGMIQQTLNPVINKPHIIVFAGDHGIAASGKVNPYPQSVTAQMVYNFVNGGAAINVFCKQLGVELSVVDAGVNHDFDPAIPIIHSSSGKGTADYSQEYAMSIEQVKECFEKGASIVQDIFQKGSNCVGFGEMGIGNTSAAALILHHYSRLPISDCVGRGTGASDDQLKQKQSILEEVSRLHDLSSAILSAEALLSKVGGFEIAMMTGAYLKAKELGIIIVVDGFIATATLLVASHIDKTIIDNCIFAHCSDEAGHQHMLKYLNAKPLLQLGLRLGEGTGAALAMPLIENAVAFLNEMASFDSAGIDGKTT